MDNKKVIDQLSAYLSKIEDVRESDADAICWFFDDFITFKMQLTDYMVTRLINIKNYNTKNEVHSVKNLIFLIDAIVRNCDNQYREIFSKKIVKTVQSAVSLNDKPLNAIINDIIDIWAKNEYFSADVVSQLYALFNIQKPSQGISRSNTPVDDIIVVDNEKFEKLFSKQFPKKECVERRRWFKSLDEWREDCTSNTVVAVLEE